MEGLSLCAQKFGQYPWLAGGAFCGEGNAMLDPMPPETHDFRIATNGTAYARCYDRLVGDAAADALATGWRRAQRFLSPPLGSAVDIACGTGRFLPEMARIAHQVYAVDRSAAMLALARRYAMGLNIRFFQQDMRRLDIPDRCDLATCRFASINYLTTDRDLKKVFAGFRRTLRPSGLLLFDLIVKPETDEAPFRHSQHVIQGQTKSKWRYFVDPRKGLSETQIEWKTLGGPSHVEIHRQRWHDEAEITQLLARSGFRVVDRFWMPRGGPDNWLQLIALPNADEAPR
jgi:SAM-dependent methyltransferase